MTKPLGHHFLLDLHDCNRALLDDLDQLRDLLVAEATRAGATVVTQVFHRYSPQGVSGVVVIAESHLALHTWPEHGFAAIDLFSCSDTVDGPGLCQRLATLFGAQRMELRDQPRGSGY